MSIDYELKLNKLKKRLVITLPVATTAAGAGIGYLVANLAENYNTELSSIENNIQEVLTYYQARELEIEAEIDNIPGLNTWKDFNEKLFGETQKATGIRDYLDENSTETHVQINPEEFSLQGLGLPREYDMYPILGLTIGLVYGITKVAGKLRHLSKERKILEAIK